MLSKRSFKPLSHEGRGVQEEAWARAWVFDTYCPT